MKKFKFTNQFFQSKVARRVTGLFLLSALVPLITTAFLSKTYITNILIDQGYSNLQNQGKYYSKSLYDRLLYIEMRLNNIASNIDHLKNKKIILKNFYGNEFSSLSIEKIRKTTLIENTDSSNAKGVRIYSKTSSNGIPSVFMSLQLKKYRKDTVSRLIAKINPEYLWNNSYEFNSTFNICVINEGGATFYCSKPLPDTVSFNKKEKQANRKVSRWSTSEGEYISATKVLFLKSKFNSSNWKIIITQLEEDVLTPVTTFNRLFPLVIILTLLVVLLVSMNQIQRSLVPLEKLTKGTRRVANRDFNEKVEVTSDDEFADLAKSFNSMTEQLKRQFATFTVLSEIDQLILSNTESEDVYFSILKHLKNIAPCDISSITVLEEDTSNIGQSYISIHAASDENKIKRITLNDKDINILQAPTNVTDMLKQADGQHFLAPIKQFGAANVCVFPVIINDHLSAIISLGFIGEVTLDEDDIQQIRNISDRIAVALSAVARDKKLYQQSYYDSLTTLPNRQLLGIRLEQEIKHCQREHNSMAILFLDLDRFKRVNDTLGHTIGDVLLQEVAVRLVNCVRETDTVARLGGDEFTIMLTGSLGSRDIGDIAENIINTLEKPFYIDRHEIFISTSIGIAVYPNDGLTANELLKNADTAMYRVKEQGRGKHLFFEEKMNIEEMERANLERDMRHALERDEFILQYQPLIELKNGNIIGAEALIRWYHPEHGLIPSSKFIPLAEETGIIEKIGEWVLRTACNQLTQWSKNNVLLDRMAVNVSCRQFVQNNFEEKVSQIIDETKIPAEKLELEITETVLMDERIESVKILDSLNKKNIHLSIDDFGTGFSSLSYLKRFPVNTLKIDRSFMQDVSSNEDAKTIVKSIIALAHTLNLSVIAEGIESPDQLALLFDYKCDFAQGYYFSEPLDAEDFEYFYLKKNNIIKFKH